MLHNILTGEARQFSELEKQIEQLGQKCLEAFTTNGVETRGALPPRHPATTEKHR